MNQKKVKVNYMPNTHGATLNGTANAQGADVTVSFDIGLDINYGTNVPAGVIPATQTGDQPVSVPVTGLAPATTYHFRLNLVNSVGQTLCNDMTFVTPSDGPPAPALPTGSTLAATNIV